MSELTDKLKHKLLELYPPYTSVLGPYLRPDGRKHIVLNNSKASKGTKGKTKTISFPKALFEANNNIILKENETIDHIDGDFTNNDDDNLQILSREQNAAKVPEGGSGVCGNCVGCEKEFELSVGQLCRPKNRTGPFCNKSCMMTFFRSKQ